MAKFQESESPTFSRKGTLRLENSDEKEVLVARLLGRGSAT